jgi:hypothetical protein
VTGVLTKQITIPAKGYEGGMMVTFYQMAELIV